MLRPSAIIWRMAGTPSFVAGIFTKTLGSAMRWWRERASAIVPSVSLAREGATSADTKPSSPPLASWTGRITFSAPAMSVTTRSQYTSSTDFVLMSSANCSS